MPPLRSLSTPIRAFRCPECRALSTSSRALAVGPEHPRYIEIPESPQQTAPYRPFVKGRLPVPRDIFDGAKGKDRAADEEIAKATAIRERNVEHPSGSREAWKQKMAEARRQNLREGLKSLRDRKTRSDAQRNERALANQTSREEALHRPEREDERLTTPSTGLDVQRLLHGALEDPNRQARLAQKARNLEIFTSAKRANRMDQLHTLYMNARSFIVTPQQLDAAIDEEFGTADNPRQFGHLQNNAPYENSETGRWSSEITSMWAYGRPSSVQDMLDKSNGKTKGISTALGMAEGREGQVVDERVRRIAEKLTGGKMEE